MINNFELLYKFTGAGLILGFFVISGIILQKIVFRRFINWAKNTQWQFDDVIFPILRKYIFFWCILSGIYFSGVVLLSSAALAGVYKILNLLFLISLIFAVAQSAAGFIKIYSSKFETTLVMSGLTQTIAQIVIFVVGFLMILSSMGISIAPILTTLGVGGLAVALALQDTLSNLFSGFHIIMAKQIKIGDYVRLDSGQEGYIADITWRTTKIRMLPDNVVLVPNDKLAKAIIINYYLPRKDLAVLIELGVHYNSDLKKVEKITIDVARQIMKEVEGGVVEFEPFIRYNAFAQSSINFTVILRAKEFTDQYLIKHEFIKRLHERYAKEGITIPYPISAINYAQEKAQG